MGPEGAGEGRRDGIEGSSSELITVSSGTPLAVRLGSEGGVGSVSFEASRSQLSKVAPSASKSIVSILSKPSATGNARARHSSTATNV